MAPSLSPPDTASRLTRTLLVAGIAAGPLFLVAGLVQGLTREGFDFGRNALSQLSLGSLGWIQDIVFVLTGLLAVAGAVGLHRTLRDAPGSTWAPRLVGLFGASFLVAALFSADPGGGFPPGASEGPPTSLSAQGAIHVAAGAIGYLALCVAFVLLARAFAARSERGWALASRLVPVGVLAGFATSSVAVPAFTAGAALGLLWLSAVTARLTLTEKVAAGPRRATPPATSVHREEVRAPDR